MYGIQIKGPESIYVFTNKKGEPYKWLPKSLKYALSRAGVGGDVTFHTLRHTFTGHLVMGGADLTAVGQLMGHKSLSKTLRYYHLSPQHKTRAIGILENRLGLTEEVEQQGVARV